MTVHASLTVNTEFTENQENSVKIQKFLDRVRLAGATPPSKKPPSKKGVRNTPSKNRPTKKDLTNRPTQNAARKKVKINLHKSKQKYNFASTSQNKMEKQIYAVGDKIFHIELGKGVVVESRRGDVYPIVVEFKDKLRDRFTKEGKRYDSDIHPSLSFTEYNYVTGGFSQERPEPEIEKGTLVYAKVNTDEIKMRYYSHKDDVGEHYVFPGQLPHGIGSGAPVFAKYVSLENPLKPQV